MDVPCGGLPSLAQLPRKIPEYGTFLKILRYAIHVQETKVGFPPELKDGMYLRIRYIMGEIDEDIWKARIYRDRKAYDKQRKFHELNHMFTLTCCDLFRRLLNPSEVDTGNTKIEKQLGIWSEFEHLREYYNRQSSGLGKKFQCVHYLISPDWEDHKAKNGYPIGGRL